MITINGLSPRQGEEEAILDKPKIIKPRKFSVLLIGNKWQRGSLCGSAID